MPCFAASRFEPAVEKELRPVLLKLVDDDVAVTESIAIVQYLTDKFPAAGIGPTIGGVRRGAYLSWLASYAGVIEPVVNYIERRTESRRAARVRARLCALPRRAPASPSCRASSRALFRTSWSCPRRGRSRSGRPGSSPTATCAAPAPCARCATGSPAPSPPPRPHKSKVSRRRTAGHPLPGSTAENLGPAVSIGSAGPPSAGLPPTSKSDKLL